LTFKAFFNRSPLSGSPGISKELARSSPRKAESAPSPFPHHGEAAIPQVDLVDLQLAQLRSAQACIQQN
jgi:hypothetical protein